MSRRIVLPRVVNVGGATLPMTRLRDMAADLGATDVFTYIASGNLLVDVDGDPAAFDRALEKAVEAEFGFFREALRRRRWQATDEDRHHLARLTTPGTARNGNTVRELLVRSAAD